MNDPDYEASLRARGVSDTAIATRVAITKEFAEFLGIAPDTRPPDTAGKAEVYEFAHRLITEGRNTLENFRALVDHAGWLGHRRLTVALTELIDCHNALQVLATVIAQRHGRLIRDEIFREPLPPLGATEEERYAATRTITLRMANRLTTEGMRQVWFQVQHGIPAEAWWQSEAADREKFAQCADIDAFLDLKRRERDTMLTRRRDANELWDTVEITDEVLAFVRSDPEMEVGRRKDNVIYITKIPYNTTRYLHAPNDRMKRYYACHCPLAREAILRDLPLSACLCTCGLGQASHCLAGLGRKLRGEILESVLRGDKRCRFAFHLDDDCTRHRPWLEGEKGQDGVTH